MIQDALEGRQNFLWVTVSGGGVGRGGGGGEGGGIVTFQCSTTGDPLKARQEFLRVALFPGDDSGERGRRSLELGHFLVQNDTRPFT